VPVVFGRGQFLQAQQLVRSDVMLDIAGRHQLGAARQQANLVRGESRRAFALRGVGAGKCTGQGQAARQVGGPVAALPGLLEQRELGLPDPVVRGLAQPALTRDVRQVRPDALRDDVRRGGAVLARQQPLRFRKSCPGGILEGTQRFRTLRRAGPCFPGQYELGVDQAGAHQAAIVGALVPASDHRKACTCEVERDVVADQLPCLAATLLGGTVEPVQCRRQAFGQAETAEQIEPSKRQLRIGTPGPCATDDCEFFAVCHRHPCGK
jgi:hypothetical protein